MDFHDLCPEFYDMRLQSWAWTSVLVNFLMVIMFLALLTIHKVGKELFTVSVGE